MCIQTDACADLDNNFRSEMHLAMLSFSCNTEANEHFETQGEGEGEKRFSKEKCAAVIRLY